MQGTGKKSYIRGDGMIINLVINGEKKKYDIKSDDFLVDVLRGDGYLSVKQACDTGSCGLCTVLIEDKAVLSCSYLAARADGANIKTIEGLSQEEKKIGEYLVEEGADQCGYCSSGLILTIIAMTKELENPSDDEIKAYLTGNLCRCTGYGSQLRAIKKYMEV